MADKIEDLIAKLAAQYEQNRAQYEQDAVQYEQINRRIEAAIAQLWAGVPSASELQDRMYDLARPIYYDFLYLIQSAPSGGLIWNGDRSYVHTVYAGYHGQGFLRESDEASYYNATHATGRTE